MSLTKPGRLAVHLVSALCIAWVVGSAAYVAHGWMTFSGLYRWAVEWELSWFGAYEVTATLLGVFVILSAPAAVLSLWVRAAEARLGPAPATLGARLRGLRRALNEPSNDLRRMQARWLMTIGLAALPVAFGTGWMADRKAKAPPAFEAVDLSLSQTPHSAHVRMTGVLQTGWIVDVTETTGALEETARYLPLTAQDWDEHQPVAYVLKPNVTAFLGERGAQSIDETTPPFEMTLRGALLPDALPGIVRATFENRGLVFAPKHYVLDMNVRADLDFAWSLAIGLGVAAGAMLLTAGLLLLANGLARRRVR